MRILVTGGSGFIGTNLVSALVRGGHEVVNADPARPRDPRQNPAWRPVDLVDSSALTALLREIRPEVVYHLGARTDLHGTGPADYRANSEGVTNLISAVRQNPGVERVFFASSRMVCRIGYQPKGDEDYCPSTPYGESKVQTERLVRAAGLECAWCLFRPTSIWGPWFGIPYKDFFMAVARGRYVHPTGRKIRKSFGFVGNSVHQLERLMAAPKETYHGKTFYLADPPLDVKEWAGLISKELGSTPPRNVPMGALKLLAALGDLAKGMGYKEPPLTRFRLANLMTEMVYDTRVIEEIAGPPVFSLEAGVRETVAWLRSAGEI